MWFAVYIILTSKEMSWEQVVDCHATCVFSFACVSYQSKSDTFLTAMKMQKLKPFNAYTGVSGTRVEKHCYKLCNEKKDE